MGPSYYHGIQTLEQMMCNILVMESYHNNKSKGLTASEMSKLLESKGHKLDAKSVSEAVRTSKHMTIHDDKIVLITWIAFTNYYLALKRK